MHLDRRRLFALVALTSSLAGATSLDFGVSYAPAGGTLLQNGLVRIGVQDVQLGGFGLAAGLSSRALDASLSRSLVLPGLGVARVRLNGAVLYTGGLRGDLNLSGTAGPVALTLIGSAWNAPLTRFGPLARWAETAPDLRGSGVALGASARYRLNRDTVLNVAGTLGGQSSVLAQAELRQGDLSYRLGVRAGQNVLGAAVGATYADPDTGVTASLDALAGPDTLGLNGSLGLDGALGEGSTVRLFAAYEPWRTTSEVLRYGAQASLPLGAGTLSLEGYGGTHSGGTGGTAGQGFGLKVGYLLPLGVAEPEADPAPSEEAPAQP